MKFKTLAFLFFFINIGIVNCQNILTFVFDESVTQDEVNNIIEDNFNFIKSRKIRKHLEFFVQRSDLANSNPIGLDEINFNNSCSIPDKIKLLDRFKVEYSKIAGKKRLFLIDKDGDKLNSIQEAADMLEIKLKDRKIKKASYYVYFKSKSNSNYYIESTNDHINSGEKISLELKNSPTTGIFNWTNLSYNTRKIEDFPTKSKDYILIYKKSGECFADTFTKHVDVNECICLTSISWDYKLDKKYSDFNINESVYGLYPDKSNNTYYIICNNTCGVDSITLKIEGINDNSFNQTIGYKYNRVVKQPNNTINILNRFPDHIVLPIRQEKIDGNFSFGENYKITIEPYLPISSKEYCNGEKVTPNSYTVVFSYCPF
jgi:hypothetical protein